MICVVRDESGTEYYGLLTDFLVERFFPEFMVNTIRADYSEKTRSDVLLLEYLNVLEEQLPTSKIAREEESNSRQRNQEEDKATTFQIIRLKHNFFFVSIFRPYVFNSQNIFLLLNDLLTIGTNKISSDLFESRSFLTVCRSVFKKNNDFIKLLILAFLKT